MEPHAARSHRALVYGLYCLSGLVSLIYQVAWFRIFVDRFGSTTLTFVLVVTNFIGGLGLGALVSRRASAWLSTRLGAAQRLRVYGALELCVSAGALLTLALGALPADLWGTFPYELRDGIFEHALGYRLSRVLIVTTCVLGGMPFTPVAPTCSGDLSSSGHAHPEPSRHRARGRRPPLAPAAGRRASLDGARLVG